MNLVPAQYRNVSVADVPVPLDEAALGGYLVGRPVYRRTRYLVVRNAGACAVVEASKESELPLFSPVTAVTVIARPEETAFVDAPDTDTAVPTQLARAAAAHAPGARCVIVRGRYGHVSFIADPAPVRVRVVEVVPPWPPKLVDQLERVLDLADDLPPVELVADLVDLTSLTRTRPAGHYLFPCRAGSASQAGPRAEVASQPSPGAEAASQAGLGAADVSYLDEIPERAPWTLVGCARSRSIHDWFYGGEVPTVDMCPRNLAGRTRQAPAPTSAPAPVLTKCCLLEDRVSSDDGLVVVPWGASLAQIRDGLRLALAAGRPAPQLDRAGDAPAATGPTSPAAGPTSPAGRPTSPAGGPTPPAAGGPTVPAATGPTSPARR
ncbi:MAG TPA: hypothetical protein VGQ26_26405 [Streptosporangiaceae bacterium]|nr:hypothetical protein [Streptosporangiaceae bacterium]